MKPYYELLYIASLHQPCTRSHLELLAKGKYQKDVAECIRLGYITPCDKNCNGDTLYCLSNAGKQLID